jgi:hypothetical protein
MPLSLGFLRGNRVNKKGPELLWMICRGELLEVASEFSVPSECTIFMDLWA